jgi:hypothetical protein
VEKTDFKPRPFFGTSAEAEGARRGDEVDIYGLFATSSVSFFGLATGEIAEIWQRWR